MDPRRQVVLVGASLTRASHSPAFFATVGLRQPNLEQDQVAIESLRHPPTASAGVGTSRAHRSRPPLPQTPRETADMTGSRECTWGNSRCGSFRLRQDGPSCPQSGGRAVELKNGAAARTTPGSRENVGGPNVRPQRPPMMVKRTERGVVCPVAKEKCGWPQRPANVPPSGHMRFASLSLQCGDGKAFWIPTCA